jgi:hypothetical protein
MEVKGLHENKLMVGELTGIKGHMKANDDWGKLLVSGVNVLHI